MLGFDGVAGNALARLCTVTSWSCGREKLFTRMGGMRRKASKFYENTSKKPSSELSDADGSWKLLNGPSGLAGVLGEGRAWKGQNLFLYLALFFFTHFS